MLRRYEPDNEKTNLLQVLAILQNPRTSNELNINLKDNDGWTLMHNICRLGHEDIVRMILNQTTAPKVDLNLKNNKGDTALMFAIKYDRKEIFKLLIHQQEHPIDLQLKNNKDQTLLMIAAARGRKEFINILIHTHKEKLSTLDINAQDIAYGDTVLIFATRFNHLEIVELLIELPNCDLQLNNNQDQTALIVASFNGNIKIVNILLQKLPADHINAQDKYGKNALLYAILNNHVYIIYMFIIHSHYPYSLCTVLDHQRSPNTDFWSQVVLKSTCDQIT